jgi:methionyl-tRNA formyltransferase
MKVVFFGSPGAALPSLEKILDAGHSIPLVISQPDRPAGRGKALTPPPVKEFALRRGIPILQPAKIRRDETILDVLKQINPDVQVVVAYGQIMPGPIIYLPRFHSLNVHFSLLPKYRGASPVQWALLNGETKTGVTIFELNEKMDEGGIVAREETEILPGETAFELEERLAGLGADLLLQTLSRIETIKPQPQDNSQATYAPKIEKEQALVDWTADASQIDRRVRAFSRRPGAYTFIQGQRIKILMGRRLERTDSARRPGEIISVAKDGVEVACGRGSVYRAERLQRENKKEMDAYALSLGMKLKPGDNFE